MNYLLHRDGQNLGSFSFQELQQQRASGQLNGSEFAWCEGMSDWEPLDTVLHRAHVARVSAAPPPLPGVARKRGLHPAALAAIIFSACAFLGVMVYSGYRGVQAGRASAGLIRFNRPFGVSSGGDSAMTAASKPITWTSNTLTAAKVTKLAGAFRQRQWVEGYEQRGDHTQACDADAERFLKTWLAEEYGGDAGTNPPNLAQWSDKLAADPSCTDPLVLTVTGLLCSTHNGMVDRLQRALDAFPASKHRAYPAFDAAVVLATELRTSPETQQDLDYRAQAFLKKSFSDGSIEPADQAEIAEILLSGWGESFFSHNGAAVTRMVGSMGNDYKWLALVLTGQYEIDEAWKARGGGYANSVTATGWQGFQSHLAAARHDLTEAWTMHPEWPAAPARMIYVSLGDSDVTEMRLWFDRTMTAQIDYSYAWTEMRWGLRPRWYGDVDSMLALGRTAVNTGRFDTDVPRKLLDVVSDVESESATAPGEHMYGADNVWPDVEKMYTGYIGAASPTERPGWRSAYAVVAFLGGKYDVSRTQLEAIDWKPYRSNLEGWDVELSLMPLEVAARTGGAAARIAEAETARSQHELTRASGIYATILSAPDTDARTREFARARAASLAVEQKLDKGDWVDFLPKSDNDPNWVFDWGGHQVTNGMLEARTGPAGHLFYSRARVGRDFEVKGEFEVVSTSDGAFQAGLIMGTPDTQGDLNTAQHWYAFRMRNNPTDGKMVSVSRGWNMFGLQARGYVHGDRNTFDFILHGDNCTAQVNSLPIMTNMTPNQTITPDEGDFLLGVGAYQDQNETVIRYRSLQVRKLERTTQP